MSDSKCGFKSKVAELSCFIFEFNRKYPSPSLIFQKSPVEESPFQLVVDVKSIWISGSIIL